MNNKNDYKETIAKNILPIHKMIKKKVSRINGKTMNRKSKCIDWLRAEHELIWTKRTHIE